MYKFVEHRLGSANIEHFACQGVVNMRHHGAIRVPAKLITAPIQNPRDGHDDAGCQFQLFT
jgi:hypothetical protein